jgi:peptide/nickel transport system ATP-binding protein
LLASSSEDSSIVRVENLTISYKTVYGNLKALNAINFNIKRGESVAIVGESGSGKSTLGLAMIRLLAPNAVYEGGSIFVDGKDVLKLSTSAVNRLRGTTAFMIFQDPLNTLNPVKRVELQMLEAVRSRCKHTGEPFVESDAMEESVQRLRDVRMPDAESIIRRYPHQLSGGQIQRVVIAMGLLMKPKVMIADEPTSALDVTVQAQVLDLMRELQKDYGMSIIFITHDINVAHSISERMVVMYAGEISESSPSDVIVKNALHPYSQALISSIPTTTKSQGKLNAISGSPPDMFSPPKGCRFHPRCPHVMQICTVQSPGITQKDGSQVRCFLYG